MFLPRVNSRDLWLIRLCYFARFAGLGFYFPFISLFYNGRGLTGTEIGLLATISALVVFMIAPLWGRWSDRVPTPHRLLQIALIGSACAMLMLGQQKVFWAMALFLCLDALSSAGIEPLSNIQALAVISKTQNAGFGSVRLWGSIGYALFAWIGGFLIGKFGLISIFLGYATTQLAYIVILQALRGDKIDKSLIVKKEGKNLKQVLSGLVKNPAMVGLAISTVLNWIGVAGLLRFESLFLNQLGASDAIIGFSATIQAFVEVPVMLLADRLKSKLGSLWIILVAFLFRAISTIPVILFPSVASVYLYRFLTATGFGFFMVGNIAFITDHTQEQERSTVMALYAGTLVSLTQMVSSPLNGLVYDHLGAYWLYISCLLCSSLAWIILRISTLKKTVR